MTREEQIRILKAAGIASPKKTLEAYGALFFNSMEEIEEYGKQNDVEIPDYAINRADLDGITYYIVVLDY